MKKRYIVFLLLILGVIGMIYLPPVQPPVFVQAEPLVHLGNTFFPAITNTMVAVLIIDVLLFLAALSVRNYHASRKPDSVPSGFNNVFEALVEGLYGTAEGTAGPKWAPKFFPWMMTIFLVVLCANMMKLIPGVDTIGIIEPAVGVKGAPAVRIVPGLCTVVKAGSSMAGGTPCEVEHEGGEHSSIGVVNGLAAPAAEGPVEYMVTAFVRPASTDLNFTLALALIAVFMTEFYGLQALGLPYLSKFFTLPIDKIAKNPMAAIDPIVGILEFVSEISRVISFTFRLFGSMFGGQVLMYVITALLPVLAPMGLGLLELFIGGIQAFVFGMLTLAFMSQAVTSHHSDDHAEEHHDAHAAEAHAH